MNPHSSLYERTKDFIDKSGLDLMFSFVDDTVRMFSLNILGKEIRSNSIWKPLAKFIEDLCFDLGHPSSILFKQELYSFYYKDKNVPVIDWDSFHEIQDVDFTLGDYYIIISMKDWDSFLNAMGEEVAYKTSKEVDKYKMMESLSE